MNGINKIVKESGINFIGSLVGLILNYALLMILTHFLTSDEFGTFVLAQSVINIFLILVLFGTPKALDRFIPFYNAAGEQGKIKTLIYSVLRVTMLLGLIIGLLLYIGARYSSQYLPNYPDFQLVLRVMVLSIPLLAFIQIASSVFIGFKELRYPVYIRRIALPLFEIFFASTVFLLGYNLLGWLWAYIFSLIGASVLAFWFFKKKILNALSKTKKISISFKKIVSYSWPLSINNVILILLGQIGIILLGLYRSPAEVGAYKIYVYLVSFLGLVLSSVAQIYKPVISGYIANKEYAEVDKIYKRVSKWIFLINSLGLMILILFGAPIIGILFSKDYLISPVALSVLAIGSYLNSAFGPEGMTLEAYGNTKLSLLNAIIMLGTNLGLSYLLIPEYGIIGAAFATAASVTLGGLAGLIEIYILYRLQPFMLSYLKYILIVISVSVVTYEAQFIFHELNIFSVGALIIFFSVIYILGLYLFQSFDELDKSLVKQIVNKFPIKTNQ